MAESPTSQNAKELDALAIIISRTAKMQEEVGLPGPPATEADTKARVYVNKVRAPVRPFVIIGYESATSYPKSGGSRTHMGNAGEMTMTFERDINPAYLSDNDDRNATLEMHNFAGQVVQEMNDLNARDDNFSFKNITQGIVMRGDVDEVLAGGNYMESLHVVEFDEGE